MTRAPGYVLHVERRRARCRSRCERLVATRRRAEPRTASSCCAGRECAVARPAARGVRVREVRTDREIARMEELRLAVIEERIEAELELDRHARARGGARRGSCRAPAARAAARAADDRPLPLAAARPRRSRPTRTHDARSSTSSGMEPGRALQQLHGGDLAPGALALDEPQGRAAPAEDHTRTSSTCCWRVGSCPCSARRWGSWRAGSRSDSTYPPTMQGETLIRVGAVRRVDEGIRARSTTSCTICSASTSEPTAVHRFFAALPAGCEQKALPTSCS